jgi:hypothetical protein
VVRGATPVGSPVVSFALMMSCPWRSSGAPFDATKVKGTRVYQNGSFGPARTFSDDGRVPQVDTSPAGRFTIVWQQASTPYRIRALSGP